ncbi:hypothetical protein AB0E04_48605 [Streptomyces sp. NPDC048251]|uniref:hypothetical protein n=1 Tax=Streptomyces sp. NPDC048251 TaxID=3154501 RepID=UPI003418B4B6
MASGDAQDDEQGPIPASSSASASTATSVQTSAAALAPSSASALVWVPSVWVQSQSPVSPARVSGGGVGVWG